MVHFFRQWTQGWKEPITLPRAKGWTGGCVLILLQSWTTLMETNRLQSCIITLELQHLSPIEKQRVRPIYYVISSIIEHELRHYIQHFSRQVII
ncbi:hypothetical protein EJB05_44408, partial [Eragrostis curvula]